MFLRLSNKLELIGTLPYRVPLQIVSLQHRRHAGIRATGTTHVVLSSVSSATTATATVLVDSM